jgi:hypothetical protein
MTDRVIEFISEQDWENFNTLFNLKSKNSQICFTDFSDIICSHDPFDSQVLSDILAQVKTKLRKTEVEDSEVLISI